MLAATTRTALRARPASGLAMRSLSTLLVGEHDGEKLSEATLSAVTACKAIGGDVELLLGGSSAKAAADSACAVEGVSKITFSESASLDKGIAEEWTPFILAAQKASGATHVVSAASAFSKGAFPRVSALLDVAMITEVTGINDASTFVRPTYAGNAITTVSSSDDIKVCSGPRREVACRGSRGAGSCCVSIPSRHTSMTLADCTRRPHRAP